MIEATWKCACCGETFPQDPEWTEEDRVAEMQANIGDLPEGDRAIVCDGCYAEIIGDHPRAEELGRAGEVRTPVNYCQIVFDPPEIEFNPRQAFVIKNVGPELAKVLMISKAVDQQIREALQCQAFDMEFHVANYLLEHPEITADDLVIEHHQGRVGEPGEHVIRLKGGAVIYTSPEIRIKVVE